MLCNETMSYLNPIFKPTTTTTKACATYESVKIATLEERKVTLKMRIVTELYITQILNEKNAYFTLAFGFRS